MTWLLWTLIGCGEPPPAPAPEPAAPAAPAPEQAPEEEEPASVARNRPPKVKEIVFRPERPVAGQSIDARVLGEDPERDPVDIDLVWMVNDSAWLDQTGRTLPGDDLKRGDRVRLQVTVSDGSNTVTELSQVIEIVNSPPELLTPPEAFADLNGLEVQARDPDNDTLRYSLGGAPDGLSIDERGVITYVGSEAAQAGTYKVTLVVDDGHRGTASLSFGITVAAGQAERRVKKGSEEATRATGG